MILKIYPSIQWEYGKLNNGDYMNGNKLIEEIEKLRAENTRLKQLLKAHNISYEIVEKSGLSVKEKIDIYKSFFKGRVDAFTEKYVRKDGGKGYSIVCSNKDTTLCQISNGVIKPCSNCKHKSYTTLTDEFLSNHMKGKNSYGIYPMIDRDKCYFLVIDFDDDEFEKAALAYKNECMKLDIDAVIELSQSGKGAHVWIFFEELTNAKKARMLGDYILINSMSNNANISFKSYDRFFPAQDMVDDKGYGNCIALPLQGNCVRNKTSVFVNDDFEMITRQIEYLARVKKLTGIEFNMLIDKICVDKDLLELNKKSIKKVGLMKSDFPLNLKIVIEDDIYISKKELSAKALVSLKRIAVLFNPDFYEKQAKRMSTYNISRIIELYKEKDEYIALPRGCMDDLIDIIKNIGIQYEIIDKRPDFHHIDFVSHVELYEEQLEAVNALLEYNNGILVAPTGSGKTIIGIEIINRIKRPTLILVDQVKLIDQWKDRILSFAEISSNGCKIAPGVLYGAKKKLSGIVDIASIKSITDNLDIYDKYEVIIGDEIHHVASQTYEDIIRKFKARYIYGLTATPKRSDHLEKIVFKSIGNIRYTLVNINSSFDKILKPKFTKFKNKEEYKLMSYTELCTELFRNDERNRLIVNDIIDEYNNGRSIIVLTERNEHIDILYELIKVKCENVYKIKGTDKTKEKKLFNEQMKQIGNKYIIISTGKYLGEGFDLPSLDTLFLTMPFKWDGKLSQALGRIGRKHERKENTLVYDYIDIKIGLFAHQFQLRLKGYKKDGYMVFDGNDKCGLLYSYNNYSSKLLDDIEKANKVLFYCNYYDKEKMDELLQLNDNICMVSDLEINYDNVTVMHSDINAIVINDEIIWYGSINPFCWAKKDDTILRIVDSEYVKDIFNTK